MILKVKVFFKVKKFVLNISGGLPGVCYDHSYIFAIYLLTKVLLFNLSPKG